MTSEVIVIGDVMLDIYEFHTSTKLSPEAPVPVIKLDQVKYSVGGAGNVAMHFALNGYTVTLISQIGDDAEGKILREHCEKNGVHCDFHVEDSVKTITKKRIVADQSQIVRIDNDSNMKIPSVLDKIKEYDITANHLVLISDYDKGVLQADHIPGIITYVKSKGAYLAVDTKKTDLSIFSNVDIITPNRTEFFNIRGVDRADSIYENAIQLIEKHNIKSFLVTLSEKGLWYVDQDNDLHCETQSEEVLDVTGAGDTVFAFWGISKIKNLNINEALKICNLAASKAVKKIGTTPIVLSGTDLLNKKKLLSTTELAGLSEIVKIDGKKIVATNGCFDVFHAGHLDSLQFAAQQGDLLVVGLNSDAAIQKLKGTNRPIVSFENRLDVLSALECVDYIVEIGTSPQSFYAELLPHVLVKGDDYSADDLIGADEVLKAGGEIKLAPKIRNFSTTELIEKIMISNK